MWTQNKSPEEYRQLADKCRETARAVSTEKERGELLAMAQTWDLIAGRVGRAPRCGERSAVGYKPCDPSAASTYSSNPGSAAPHWAQTSFDPKKVAKFASRPSPPRCAQCCPRTPSPPACRRRLARNAKRQSVRHSPRSWRSDRRRTSRTCRHQKSDKTPIEAR
jgi:hypothetical protein